MELSSWELEVYTFYFFYIKLLSGDKDIDIINYFKELMMEVNVYCFLG